MPRRHREGHVYFAYCQGYVSYVKIGFCTVSPQSRIAALQTGCPDRIRLIGWFDETTQRFERRVHEEFKEFRIRGEWFFYDELILEYLVNSRNNGEFIQCDDFLDRLNSFNPHSLLGQL